MKAAELRSKSVEELNKLLIDIARSQFNLRMQKGLGEAFKSHQFKIDRRDVARIKTVIREKEKQS